MARKIDTDANIDKIRIKEQGSTPSNPDSGYGYLYEKSDNKPYFIDDGGNEYNMVFSSIGIQGQDEGVPLGTGTTLNAVGAGVTMSISGSVLRLSVAGGAGNATYTGTVGSEPGGVASGDLFLSTNDGMIERYNGLSWNRWGVLPMLKDPSSQSWVWVNSGTANVTSMSNGWQYIYQPSGAGVQQRIRKITAPATPYTVTAKLLFNPIAGGNCQCSILFRESSSGKLVTMAMTAAGTIEVSNWNSPSAFSGVVNSLSSAWSRFGGVISLRIRDDGANRICSVSADGMNYIAMSTVARTTFMTADEIGFALESENAEAGLTLISWEITS